MTDISVTPNGQNGNMDTATKPRQKRQKRDANGEIFTDRATAMIALIDEDVAAIDAEIDHFRVLIADREALKSAHLATRKVWEKRQG